MCVAHTFSAPHHACTGCPHFHVYSLPIPSHGPHSRCPCRASAFQHVTTYRACAPGAQWRPVVPRINCCVVPRRPIHPGKLKPTTLRLRRLAPDSCSVGLSPTLSLSLSLLPFLLPSLSLSFSPFLSHCAPLSLSLLSVPLPLRPTLLLSRIKGVFGTFGGSLSPPGFGPSSTGQKRCGISTGLRRVVICITCSNLSYSPLRVIPCHAYLLSHGGVLSSV